MKSHPKCQIPARSSVVRRAKSLGHQSVTLPEAVVRLSAHNCLVLCHNTDDDSTFTTKRAAHISVVGITSAQLLKARAATAFMRCALGSYNGTVEPRRLPTTVTSLLGYISAPVGPSPQTFSYLKPRDPATSLTRPHFYVLMVAEVTGSTVFRKLGQGVTALLLLLAYFVLLARSNLRTRLLTPKLRARSFAGSLACLCSSPSGWHHSPSKKHRWSNWTFRSPHPQAPRRSCRYPSVIWFCPRKTRPRPSCWICSHCPCRRWGTRRLRLCTKTSSRSSTPSKRKVGYAHLHLSSLLYPLIPTFKKYILPTL